MVRLPAQGAGIDESQRLDYEKEDYFGYRWWKIQEVLVPCQVIRGAACLLACCASDQMAGRAVRSFPGTRRRRRPGPGHQVGCHHPRVTFFP